MRREDALVGAFVDMADTLVDEYDVVELLHRLVEHCIELLAVDASGLLLGDQRGGLQVVASSSEQTRLLELFQLQANEGPCLDCFTLGEPVMVADLTEATDRWPSFSAEAAKDGFRAVIALPLRLRSQTIGAINLFKTEPGVLSAEDLRVAQALADVATIGILQERAIQRVETVSEQLQTALNSRVIIEQAKGVLAERAALAMDEAFARLRSYARNHNLRLRAVAQGVVEGSLNTSAVLAAPAPEKQSARPEGG